MNNNCKFSSIILNFSSSLSARFKLKPRKLNAI